MLMLANTENIGISTAEGSDPFLGKSNFSFVLNIFICNF